MNYKNLAETKFMGTEVHIPKMSGFVVFSFSNFLRSLMRVQPILTSDTSIYASWRELDLFLEFYFKFRSIEQTITFKSCFISEFKCNGLNNSFEIK